MNDKKVRRIVVANAKGGSGKTTVATNLASAYVAAGRKVALLDYDCQGSSIQWLRQRSPELAPIHGIEAFPSRCRQVTRSFALRLPPEVERVVVDTPAGLKGLELQDRIRGAHVILVPVLPSPLDMIATADFVRELLQACRSACFDARVALVANRVRRDSRLREGLKRFFAELDLPVLGQIRDSHNYLIGAEQGCGVAEFKGAQGRNDKRIWRQLVDWIETAPGQKAPARPLATTVAATEPRVALALN